MSSQNGNAPLPPATQPRRGYEAAWEFGDGTVRPMPNFGSRPSSPPYGDPDRGSRIRDALVAALLVGVLICSAGVYVSGLVSHTKTKPSPGQLRDPFAVVGGREGR